MWAKIELHSDYHSYYSLNEMRLENNERVAVRFSDGHILEGLLRVSKIMHERRGGMDETTSRQEVFLGIDFHCSRMELLLKNGMEAKRV